jgi:hypothetical protein
VQSRDIPFVFDECLTRLCYNRISIVSAPLFSHLLTGAAHAEACALRRNMDSEFGLLWIPVGFLLIFLSVAALFLTVAA